MSDISSALQNNLNEDNTTFVVEEQGLLGMSEDRLEKGKVDCRGDSQDKYGVSLKYPDFEL